MSSYPVVTRPVRAADLARALAARAEFAKLSRAAKIARADREGASVYRPR